MKWEIDVEPRIFIQQLLADGPNDRASLKFGLHNLYITRYCTDMCAPDGICKNSSKGDNANRISHFRTLFGAFGFTIVFRYIRTHLQRPVSV